MQNQPVYRTAEELDIRQWERDGLAALVGPLGRDELPFYMGTWEADYGCGTVRCIAGHLAARQGRDAHDYGVLYRSHALYKLFCPDSRSAYYAKGPQAARAIINFLTLGDPSWDEVMASA